MKTNITIEPLITEEFGQTILYTASRKEDNKLTAFSLMTEEKGK